MPELSLDAGDQLLPATLTLPPGKIRAGMVALHGSSDPGRDYFLYAHLAELLPPLGVAVLRFDRRADPSGRDIRLAQQAQDALVALAALRGHCGSAPVGLWGYSQGAWVAPLVAADHPDQVGFLIELSSCGVSPAEQMRYGIAEQLRRNGFGPADIAQAVELRRAVETYLRGDGDRATAQAAVREHLGRPWFPLAGLSSELPLVPGTWPDMDFQPEPVFTRTTCPVLGLWGETDQWVPVAESISAWRRARPDPGLTVTRLPGSDHLPTLDTPHYADALTTFFRSHPSFP